MHFILIILLSLLCSESVYAQNLLSSDKVLAFYKQYYANDIESFSPAEKELNCIFDDAYINNTFEMDFRIALYSMYVNNNPKLKEQKVNNKEKIALVVHILKHDVYNPQQVYYANSGIGLDSAIMDIKNEAVRLISNLVLVDTREEMIAREKVYPPLNEYCVPKECYLKVMESIKKYK